MNERGVMMERVALTISLILSVIVTFLNVNADDYVGATFMGIISLLLLIELIKSTKNKGDISV
ncbi:hypothetical protein [Virgibacillus dokdonensis]|uniref:hypothetical protein n=1 Tax=Virgibacillus dokdonensis TaxID=302167 RepID=UPI0015F26A36|nr:hypothetical protein [Virgibacillus dokdonensis]